MKTMRQQQQQHQEEQEAVVFALSFAANVNSRRLRRMGGGRIIRPPIASFAAVSRRGLLPKAAAVALLFLLLSMQQVSGASQNGGGVYRYNICNGLSNQLLYHAASIAIAIENEKAVAIPNHYIVNGVQTTNKDVLPSPRNSIPFNMAFDRESFVKELSNLGLKKAVFVTFDGKDKPGPAKCAGMGALHKADPFLVRQILLAFKPSKKLEQIVQGITDSLDSSGSKKKKFVCVHHRDGKDWHDHCKRWSSIKDGVYRGNCLGVPNRTFVESLDDRGLAKVAMYGDTAKERSIKRRVYYCGDHDIPDKLKTTTAVVSQFRLMDDGAKSTMVKEISKQLDEDEYTTEHNMRDMWALIDFYVCRDIPHFIGNSVSTFSAVQIAMRQSENAYWYNSQSIPLADIWQAYTIPIVYTYTELSKSTGKLMLQASIASIKKHMPMTNVHILYHGKNDKEFRKWLTDKGVILHQHDPAWRGKIEEMRKNGDKLRSNLFLHSGNYFGTWQRIDIPLFIKSEYALLLDSDTIVVKPFTLADFGLNMTYGIAMSSEIRPKDKTPSNAGIMLMNIPKMRQTYGEFLFFILSHVSNGAKFDHPSPSDQGAYLEFYGKLKLVSYLSWKFNFKPYWGDDVKLEDAYIVHFHGPKPHDYMKRILGIGCDKAIRRLCWRAMRLEYLCPTLQHFAIATRRVDRVAYCNSGFERSKPQALFCNEIMSVLAMQQGKKQCEDFPSLVRQALHRIPEDIQLPRDKIEKNLSGPGFFGSKKKNLAFAEYFIFVMVVLFFVGRWRRSKKKEAKLHL